MNINYENMHCQRIGIFNGKLDKTHLIGYYKHYAI